MANRNLLDQGIGSALVTKQRLVSHLRNPKKPGALKGDPLGRKERGQEQAGDPEKAREEEKFSLETVDSEQLLLETLTKKGE